jgi:hypothetical protein
MHCCSIPHRIGILDCFTAIFLLFYYFLVSKSDQVDLSECEKCASAGCSIGLHLLIVSLPLLFIFNSEPPLKEIGIKL